MAQRTRVPFRVRVWHDDDTAVDISDRIIGGPKIYGDIDAGDWKCTMTIDNSFTWVKASLSLDPKDELSTHNLDSSSALDPLLTENHAVQVDTYESGAWVVRFQGYAGSPVRDSSVVSKRHTISFKPYGITMGLKEDDRVDQILYSARDLATSLLTSILKQSGRLGKLSHVVVLDDPLAQVTEYVSKAGSPWAALQAAVAPTGYVLASRHHASGVAYNDGSGESTPSEGFYLTMYNPLRAKTAVDYTWTDECEGRSGSYSIDDTRTWVRVAYEIANGAQKYTTPATDDAARLKWGIPAGDGTKLHRKMQLVENNNSFVKTKTVAETYRDFALHDTSAATSYEVVKLDELWTEPSLHSLVEFSFNDYTVQMGITNIEYDLSADTPGGRTVFTGAVDKVIGLRNYWLGREMTDEERTKQRLSWLEGGMEKLPTPRVLSYRRWTYQTRTGETRSAMSIRWERCKAYWYGYTAVYLSYDDKLHYPVEPTTTSRSTSVVLDPLPAGVDVYFKLKNFPATSMSPQGRR